MRLKNEGTIQVVTGSPSHRLSPRRYVGLPGAWTVLLLRAVVVHPAGHDSPSPNLARAAVVFGPFNTLDTRDEITFVAAFPTAHALAHLRIAGRVTATVARLATGWAGSPFAGRVSHPLDDVPNFIRFSPISLLSDQPCLVALNALATRRVLGGDEDASGHSAGFRSGASAAEAPRRFVH